MTFKSDLEDRVRELARSPWAHIPNATVLPTTEDLTFGNTGERLDVCILYADIHGSTKMVDELSDTLASEYYKAFLHCAGQIIRRNTGSIQAYDGDRVMAVYVGQGKEDRAVSTALEINFAVARIINPVFLMQYGTAHRQLRHTVGIDAGRVLVAKTGVRNANDLVWVGAAANYAAKLNSFDGLDAVYPTRATAAVVQQLAWFQRYDGVTDMWEGPYTDLGKTHYRSNWMRTLP